MAFIFPVIGKSEWSGGSWMPDTQTHRGRTHSAIDIYAARGQSIVSPVTGTVRASGSSNIGGNWVQIEAADGAVYYFAHMQDPTTVTKGQRVSAGNIIGKVGNTGSAKTTSPHVHFSVKVRGRAVNPTSMLQSAVVVPDLEFEKTGVEGGAGIAPGGFDRAAAEAAFESGAISEPLPPQAQEGTPAWFEQLEAYRKELSSMNGARENPKKIKASRILHGTLSGMANMVRSAGFDVGTPTDTGIDDPNEITREAGAR